MSESLTDYYVTGRGQLLRIEKVRMKTIGQLLKLDRTPPENQNPLLEAGVADFVKENRLYLDLIRSTGCDQMKKDEIFEAITKFTCWAKYSRWMQKSHKPDQDSESDGSALEISIWGETAIKIVNLRISKNWSILSICAKFSVTQEHIRRTFDRV